MTDVSRQEIQSMKEIVDLSVGIPRYTYEMQQNAPRPDGEYCALKCTNSFNPGYDETRIVTIDGQDFFRSRGVRILTFAVMFTRQGQEFIDYDNSFFRPDVLAKLRQVGFAAMGKQSLNLASLTLETNWEVRHGIVVQYNVLREQTSPVDTMSDAYVEGKFYDGNNVINIKGN